MAGHQEVEIKFRIESIPKLTERLEGSGFHQVTRRTHEMNTLYDLPGQRLRRRGALLRIRKYGDKWTVTYKDRSAIGPGSHKVRREIETAVDDGPALVAILAALGFKAGFAYEKFRSEWRDSPPSSHRQGPPDIGGCVVIDETPIGDFGEIEGSPEWIDAVAHRLGIPKKCYITASYAELFLEWKRRTGNRVEQMRFAL